MGKGKKQIPQKKKKHKKKKKIAQGKEKSAGLQGVDYCRLVYNCRGSESKGVPFESNFFLYLFDRACIRKPKVLG